MADKKLSDKRKDVAGSTVTPNEQAAFNEEQANEALAKQGLAGASRAQFGSSIAPNEVSSLSPIPPPTPQPWVTPSAMNPMWALAAALNKVNPYTGLQQPPQYSIQQPPPGLPTIGYEGPVQLPTPPQAGMPRP